MLPPTYNANLQILQTRDQVIIRHEMMHDVRIIYLDGRSHPGPNVQWLAGHSVRPLGRQDARRRHYELHRSDQLQRIAVRTRRQDIFASERLHVIERFTPTDANTIRYAFTVEDPDTWTACRGRARWQLRRADGPIYEYACHEGNYGLANILRAARVAEEKQQQ